MFSLYNLFKKSEDKKYFGSRTALPHNRSAMKHQLQSQLEGLRNKGPAFEDLTPRNEESSVSNPMVVKQS